MLTAPSSAHALPAGDVERSASHSVICLIALALVLRVAFAASTGLGIDESYTVATGRQLAWSTYDHPPMAWWLACAGSHLFGTDASLAVRLPFILIFAGSTWQMFRLGSLLFGARAGLYAALALNVAPALGVTTGTWVLPDGPLTLAMLSGAHSLARLFFARDTKPSVWLAAGAWGGLALLSKYHGIFLFAGTFVFLLTSAPHRFWLVTRWPYLATALAALFFLPVLGWNVDHDFVSFGFQTTRAVSTGFQIWMPLVTMLGQSIFLLPWIWFGLVAAAGSAMRAGAADARRWFLVCLGAGPVVIFTLVSAWSHSLFFHWAMPGYLMWLPLLGQTIRQGLDTRPQRWSPAVRGSPILVATLVVSLILLALAPVSWSRMGMHDPLADLRSWQDVRTIFAQRGFMMRSGLFVATEKWHEAGRLDYALQGDLPVTCLCDDARGYGILAPPKTFVGQDALIVVDLKKIEQSQEKLQTEFQKLERLPDITLRHAKDSVATFGLFYGHSLKPRLHDS